MTDNSSIPKDASATRPQWVRLESPAAGRAFTPVQLVALGLLFTFLIGLIFLAARARSTAGAIAGYGGISAGGLVHVIILLAILFDAIFGLLLLSVLRPARRKRDDDEPERTYQPPPVPWFEKVFLGALPFLLLAALGMAIYLLHGLHVTPAAPGGRLPPATSPLSGGPTSTPSSGTGTPAFTGIELGIALAFTAVVLVAALWWLRRERGPAAGEGSRLSHDLSGALDESLEDVLRESDPRRAVIAAYARMERVLAGYGLPRREYEAPLEYLARVFARFNVSGEALRHLTDLFELARFSHHEVGAPMKERAVAALITVRDELRRVG